MNLEEGISMVYMIKSSNIHKFSKEYLLPLLKIIDKAIKKDEESLASASKNYDKAVKATPLGENLPTYYEDFVEPYEDTIEFFENKKGLIEHYLAEIEAKESKEVINVGKNPKGKTLYSLTKSGFSLEEDSPDDLVVYQKGKPILKISIPEMATQWNTRLP